VSNGINCSVYGIWYLTPLSKIFQIYRDGNMTENKTSLTQNTTNLTENAINLTENITNLTENTTKLTIVSIS
jgi:beta-lactamase regulating signal transducer with metallopeptidase domain